MSVNKRVSVKKAAVLVLAALLVCLSFSFLQIRTQAAGDPEVLASRKGVVRVVYESDTYLVTGSAFGVGPAGEETQYFVTCYHVVNPNYSSFETYDTVYIATGDSLTSDIYSVEVLYADADKDIAILKTSQPVQGRMALPLIPSEYIEPTMDIYCVGFPGISDMASDYYYVDQNLESGIDAQTITTGTITRTKLKSGNVLYYQVDADINHGNSGGPTVTGEGYVIGINEAIMADQQGGNYLGLVTHIDYVIDILNQLGVPYEIRTDLTDTQVDQNAANVPDDVQEIDEDEVNWFDSDEYKAMTDEMNERMDGMRGKTNELSTMVIVLIVVVAVVVVFFIIFLIIILRKDKKLEKQIAAEREQYMSYGRVMPRPADTGIQNSVPSIFANPMANAQTGAQTGAVSPFAPGASSAASSAAPAGAPSGAPSSVVSPQASPMPAPAPQAAPMQTASALPKCPSVFGTAGFYAGRNFEISTSIVMGRSKSRCHLVYPQDTPGISNVHLEVLNRGGKLVLVDRGSSYGTFLNGEKLTASQAYELKDGDNFTLASPANMFTVKY